MAYLRRTYRAGAPRLKRVAADLRNPFFLRTDGVHGTLGSRADCRGHALHLRPSWQLVQAVAVDALRRFQALC